MILISKCVRKKRRKNENILKRKEKKKRMDIREEWNFRDRTGDRSYEKQNWKKTPLERFQSIVSLALDKVPLSDTQREWVETRTSRMPSYEDLNPVALVLGYVCIDQSSKKMTREKFQSTDRFLKKNQSWIRSFSVLPIDIVRYARQWERWLRDNTLEY